MTSIAPLVLAAAFAQAAAVPQEDPTVIPRGTPEDQQLWHALRLAANQTKLGMGRIAQCSFRIQYGKYYEGLDDVLKGGAEPERAEAKALREKLAAEATAAEAAVPERPGLRECEYVLRDLGLYMPNLSEPAAKQAMPATRKQARGCLQRLEPLARKILARAEALERALADVDVFQGRRAAAAAAASAKVPTAATEPAATPPAAKAPAGEGKP